MSLGISKRCNFIYMYGPNYFNSSIFSFPFMIHAVKFCCLMSNSFHLQLEFYVRDLHLSLPSGHFRPGLPTKILYAFVIWPVFSPPHPRWFSAVIINVLPLRTKYSLHLYVSRFPHHLLLLQFWLLKPRQVFIRSIASLSSTCCNWVQFSPPFGYSLFQHIHFHLTCCLPAYLPAILHTLDPAAL